MLKMLLDPMGGIVLTNDGNAILREVSINECRSRQASLQIMKFLEKRILTLEIFLF